MQCFVLGTGGMMPMPARRLTSVVVRPTSRMIQLDCGEGVQVGFKQLRLGVKALAVVAITHLHADHCLGLPGMLMFRAQCDDPGPIVIVGPRGLGRFVHNVIRDLGCHIGFELDLREWARGADPIAYQDDELVLTWEPLVHTVPCLGYRLEERVRPGRFDVGRASELGIPQGPLWGALQAGQTVSLDGGRQIRPDEVLGPPRRGRIVAYCTDTAPCSAIESLCRGADVAFVEAMFMPEHADEGRDKLHLTVDQAARATARAGASQTVHIHISPRYGPAEVAKMGEIAAQHNPTARVGRDLMMIDVPLP